MSATSDPPTSSSHTAKPKRRKRLRILLIIIGVLVLIRVLLPIILLRVANDRLAHIKGYYGHIDDLDLALLRGAYMLDVFHLEKVDSVSQKHTPFIAAQHIDLSLQWRALFKGRLVGELVFDEPDLRFTRAAAEPGQVVKDTTSLGDLLKDFMPLKINRLEFRNGRLSYVDPTSTPKVDLEMTAIQATATNLKSVVDRNELLPSDINATASLYGGSFKLKMKMDALAKVPTFDLDLRMEGAQLNRTNDFFKAYAKCDVNKGAFAVYAEMATRNGAFRGYVKPLITDLDVLGPEDKHDPFFHKVWEGLIGTIGDILKNNRTEEVGTKVSMAGRLDKLDVRTWEAVWILLRNGFIEALRPKVDNEINIHSPAKAQEEDKRGLLKRLFGKDEKDDKKEKKKASGK